MSKKRISSAVWEKVAKRANYRCEYCKTTMEISTQKFEVKHIIARSQGGEDSFDNFALACRGCNAHKYIRNKGFDSITQVNVELYHPRHDAWFEHFAWDSNPTFLIGLTPKGRATIVILKLNRPQLISVRKLLERLHMHPPKDEDQ